MCEVETQGLKSEGPKQNRNRFFELSRPKESRSIWITSHGPRVQWGTQETLWPVTQAAMSVGCTPRLLDLAEPKKNFQDGDEVNRQEFMFSCGRDSVIWKVAPAALQSNLTSRLASLALAKNTPETYVEDRPLYVYSCGRASPLWQTSGAAAGDERPRTETLAQAKSLPVEYRSLRNVQTEIPRAALTAGPSGRMETLAAPKHRSAGHFREPIWPVSEGARSATPSNRCLELAHSKPLADGYLPPRGVIWEVSNSARKTAPTQRMEELSRPIIRATMDHVQFDPDAFLVKETAKKARCSKRTEELAEPIRR